MTDQIAKFLDHMREYGCEPESVADVLPDDVRRYYRLAGDKSGVKKGSYVLRVEADGFAVGGCMNMREGVWHGWHSKSKRGATAEEKAEWQARREAAKAAREEAERVERLRAVEAARVQWDEGAPARRHDYADRKLMRVDGLRTWLDDRHMEDVLLIPVWNRGEMVGLQKVYGDGEKLFTPWCDMAGGHVWIGSAEGAVVIAVGEGYATCDTAAQATGWPVCVAFNAGNLKAVASMVRRDHPNAQVVILADMDLWTWDHKHRKNRPDVLPSRDAPEWDEWREKGWLRNVGHEAATQAAAAIGGAQVLGVAEGGDWNDLHVSAGIDEVRERLVLPVEVAQQWEPDYVGYDDEPVGLSYEDAIPLDRIKPLGHDRGTFFFFPKATGQIMEYSATALAQPANLYAMADRSFWDGLYNHDGKMSSRQIADIAAGDLMKECRAKGIFNPDNSRGVGVWKDGKDIVVNTGEEVVVVGGGRFKPQDYKGKAVYEAGPLVYDLGYEPLRNKEAAEIRDTAKRFNWRQSIMGDLLAGFVVLAPIGGVLKWRPHVVVTGEKGAGKSTALDNFIKVLIGEPGIYLDGGTTEAGMRKEIGLGSQPVVMDEGESETKKSRESMEGIFFLARRSSSGSKSATAMGRVNVRSCFCVAAINPRIVQGPDKDRWSTLELVKDTREGREDRWRAFELDIRRVATEESSKRLLARTVENLPTLLANIDVFRVAASKALGDARAGDQIGPLIAGAFSLVSTKKVDEAFAAEWIAKQDWQWRDADVDVPEHEKFLATVLTMRLRYDKDGMGRESDIGAMIEAASRRDSMIHAESVDGLKQIGVKVEGDRIVFSNNSPKLAAMLKDTVWSEWRRLLMKFEGADNCGNRTIRFGKGISGKAVSIPLYHAMGDGEEEISIVADEGEGF